MMIGYISIGKKKMLCCSRSDERVYMKSFINTMRTLVSFVILDKRSAIQDPDNKKTDPRVPPMLEATERTGKHACQPQPTLLTLIEDPALWRRLEEEGLGRRRIT